MWLVYLVFLVLGVPVVVVGLGVFVVLRWVCFGLQVCYLLLFGLFGWIGWLVVL